MTNIETSIFTKIINREIPADIVYEDDTVIAFLTIEPINPGHTLVVPKKPFVNIFDGNETVLGIMMATAKKISNSMLASGLGSGVNLIMNNGTDAGQEVFHAHLHVVPRLEKDGALLPPQRVTLSDEETRLVASRIKSGLQTS